MMKQQPDQLPAEPGPEITTNGKEVGLSETLDDQQEMRKYWSDRFGAVVLSDSYLRQLAMNADYGGPTNKLYDPNFGGFTGYLTEKYNGQAVDYLMYHVLIGSTLRVPAKYFDLAGGDSIVNFIERLERGEFDKK